MPNAAMSLSYDTIYIAVKVLSVVLVIVSASLHEFGHAYAAHACGDDTAKEAGRLTINPLAHIDLFGSVLLPLLLVFSGFGYMAYAKPVPYNPNRLRNPRRDEVTVAVAGPIANLLQAAAGAILYHVFLGVVYGNSQAPYYINYLEVSPIAWVGLVLQLYVQVNCSLAFFNLLPIPPLDGSKIISPLMRTPKQRHIWYTIQAYALPVTMLCIWVLPTVAHIDPIGWWLDLTAGTVETLLLGW